MKRLMNKHSDVSTNTTAAEHTSILTELGRRQARLVLIIWLAGLKALSDGTEVAGIAKYFQPHG